MNLNGFTKALNGCGAIITKARNGIHSIIENPSLIKTHLKALIARDAKVATYKIQGYRGTLSLFYPGRDWGDPMYDSLDEEYLADLIADKVTHIGVIEDFGNQDVYHYLGFHAIKGSQEVPEGFSVFEVALLDSSNPKNPDDHYIIHAEVEYSPYGDAYKYDISALIYVEDGEQADRFREMIESKEELPVKFDKESMSITLI